MPPEPKRHIHGRRVCAGYLLGGGGAYVAHLSRMCWYPSLPSKYPRWHGLCDVGICGKDDVKGRYQSGGALPILIRPFPGRPIPVLHGVDNFQLALRLHSVPVLSRAGASGVGFWEHPPHTHCHSVLVVALATQRRQLDRTPVTRCNLVGAAFGSASGQCRL